MLIILHDLFSLFSPQQLQASFDQAQDEADHERKALKTAQRDTEQLILQLTEAKGQLISSKDERDQCFKQTEGLKVEIKVTSLTLVLLTWFIKL